LGPEKHVEVSEREKRDTGCQDNECRLYYQNKDNRNTKQLI